MIVGCYRLEFSFEDPWEFLTNLFGYVGNYYLKLETLDLYNS